MTPIISPETCEIRGIESRDEVKLVADLYGKAFGRYEWHYNHHVDVLLRRVPRGQWRLSRVLWALDGTPVAQVRICHRVMRLGSALLRVAGLGDVCTHPFHRKRGLMRHLFAHCLEFMAHEGYGLSLLWGIGRFYDKFGYITAFSDGTLQMPRDQVARLNGPYRGRRVAPTDLDALVKLHRDDYAIRDGAMRRPGTLWAERALEQKFVRVLVDGTEQPRAAYWATPDGDALVLKEVYLGRKPDRPAILSVLADLVKLAKTCETPQLRFELPPEHPIGRFAVADGCQVRRYHGHRGGAMARVIDLDALATHMAAEWTRLLAASPLAGWTGRFRLDTGTASLDLVIAGGQVVPAPAEGRATATLRASQDKLTRLLLGLHPPEAALMLGEIRLTRSALPLATILFPARPLHVAPADRF